MEDINTIINEQLVKLNVESGCANYKISKKYTNEKTLLNDNDKVIYYDKEFDLTDYDFINKYQKELSSLPKEEFIIFLSKKLQEDKKLTPDKSVEANAMLSKQRVVLDNIYAILQTDDFKKYYIRKNNKWLLDNDIKDNINSKERWDSLCNVQQDCLIVKNDCVNGSNYINEQLLKNVLTEYDTKNEANKFEITEQLNSDIVNSKDILDKLNYNNTKKSFKHNDYQISIGNDVSVFEGILSPHIELRDRIIGYQDFVKKQTYIVQFAEKYTRLPNEIDEEQHWLYCIETSTKLLPKFMLILANAYIQNLDYNQKLQELCRDIGVLSDDGDTWVDKHSGYVIKSIEFDTDEGYDESGFKYKSRDELAQDLASNFSLENVKLSPEVLVCHNIINALENFIGINISSSKSSLQQMFLFN